MWSGGGAATPSFSHSCYRRRRRRQRCALAAAPIAVCAAGQSAPDHPDHPLCERPAVSRDTRTKFTGVKRHGPKCYEHSGVFDHLRHRGYSQRPARSGRQPQPARRTTSARRQQHSRLFCHAHRQCATRYRLVTTSKINSHKTNRKITKIRKKSLKKSLVFRK